MKISIDESVFNNAIKNKKFELAEWLIEQNCPVKSSVYFQNLELDTLKWLNDRNIPLDKNSMHAVIELTDSQEIIQWFIQNGVVIDSNVVNSCIRTKDVSYIKWFLYNYNVKLDSINYEIAVLSENIPVLDLLYELKCPYDSSITYKALRNLKKKSIKWLVERGLFDE
jgi:hypothetical protein